MTRNEWQPAVGSSVQDGHGVRYRVVEVEPDAHGWDVLVQPTVSEACPPFWIGSKQLTQVAP